MRETHQVASYLRDLSRRYVEAPVEADKQRSGLTVPQISVIAMLFDSGPQSLRELSGSLGLSHSTVSGIVDRLERRGLVRRDTDETDRRRTSISVTAAVDRYAREDLGRQQVGRLLPIMRSATAAERKVIADGLRTLHDLAQRT
ncbi:MAG: MarR family transcriptional regulator [Candidatus Dormibacteraeota bacterium]|nr:MarR family transcriptional regulator [Candidatus Dormibacteraeota bacterium]